MKRIVLLIILLGTPWLVADEASRNKAISERIQPFGKECLKDQPCATTVVQRSASAGTRSAESIYNTHCSTCHTTGVAGSPKLGDAAAWASRRNKGLDALLETATKGIGAMPPMGLCLDCSPDELMGSIEYILDNSR